MPRKKPNKRTLKTVRNSGKLKGPTTVSYADSGKDDKNTGCEICSVPHPPKRCPLIRGNVRVNDTPVLPKALLTLPDVLRSRKGSKGAYEIFAREALCQGTQFGPLVAPTSQNHSPGALKLFKQKVPVLYFDSRDLNLCNWMVLLQPVPEDSPTRNCICYQLEGSLYFTVTRQVDAGEALTIGLAPGYRALVEGNDKALSSTSTISLVDVDVEVEPEAPIPEHDNSTGVRRSERKRKGTNLGDDYVVELPSSPSKVKAEREDLVQLKVEIDDDEDFIWAEGGIEEVDLQGPLVSPSAFEIRRKEKLRRLGAVLAAEEWECKFCNAMSDKIEDFCLHLIDHYKKVGAARTEKSRLIKQTQTAVPDIGPTNTTVDTGPTHPDKENSDSDDSGQEEPSSEVNTEVGDLVDETGVPKYPYTCDLCVKKRFFNRAEYLIRHLRKHVGDYVCHECGLLVRPVFGESHVCQDQEDRKQHGPARSARKKPVKVSQCTICKRPFRTARDLNHHLQRKHGKTYNCPTCTRIFVSEEKVQDHSCKGKPAAPADPILEVYACEICAKTFPLLTALEKHLRLHGCTIACSICTKGLSHNKLKAHMAICETLQAFSQGELDPLKCPTCHEPCTSLQLFRDHMTSHTHPFMCPSCTLRFPSNAEVKGHECPASFSCDGCSTTFDKFAALKKHFGTEHPEAEYFCFECAIPFVTQEGLAGHRTCDFDPTISVDPSKPTKKKRKNYQDGNFMCEKCGASYNKWSSLKTHRQTHGPKRFACRTCGKSFHRREMLAEHEFVHEPAQFECPECGKKVKSKKSLEVHLRIHSGIKRFQCQECGKAFTQKVNLITHQMTHVPTADKGFICQYCSKKFSSKEYLGFHVQAHETGRNQVCDLCGNSFVKAHMLMQHKRAAHGTQRYKCEFCLLEVKQKHSLRRHLEKRHGELSESWSAEGYLESRFEPGDGTFVAPVRKKSRRSNVSDSESEEEVVEEHCLEELVLETDDPGGDPHQTQKMEAILGQDVEPHEGLVELDGEELLYHSEETMLMNEPDGVMLIQMEEGGDFVFALASETEEILVQDEDQVELELLDDQHETDI